MSNKTIGIVGGGQLGMFICEAAKKKNIRTIVYSTTNNFSAKNVCDDFIIGEYYDNKKLDQFIINADFFTIETENIPINFLKEIEIKKNLFPSSKIIEIAQNRLREKNFLNSLDGIKTVEYFEINNFDELIKYSNEFNCECILKTQEFGYDGKGQYHINQKNLSDFKSKNLNNHILEKKICFDLEISVIVSRSKSNYFSYPPVENLHKDSILRKTTYPAKINQKIKFKSRQKAELIANKLNFYGVLAIEMFVIGEEILINEIAPRPHNSGHWTIDASGCSQFENLISIMTDEKSINPEPFKNCSMVNIIGNEYLEIEKLKHNYKVYDYSKEEVKSLRKMGHYVVFD